MVYNTLRDSKLWLWAVVEPVAYFATIDASIVVTTSVELLSRQSLLDLILGVVILVGTTLFPFHIFVERS